MGTYRQTCSKCGDSTETESWEPEDCPFCELESLREAVRKVKTHVRDADAGVLRLGLRDNDESRVALNALFELTPNDHNKRHADTLTEGDETK